LKKRLEIELDEEIDISIRQDFKVDHLDPELFVEPTSIESKFEN
jgi:hypothetical protein